MTICDNCIHEVINNPSKTSQDDYTWQVMNPCHDCLNTYNQPPGFMKVSIKRAKELLGLRG